MKREEVQDLKEGLVDIMVWASCVVVFLFASSLVIRKF